MADSPFAESSAKEHELHPATGGRRARIWPWLVLLACVAALVAVRMFGPPDDDRDGNGRRHPAVGTRLTQVSLQPLTGGGEPISETDLAGKVTAINFWATWCGPCRMEFPHLVRLEHELRERDDFQFLSVSCAGSDEGEALRRATEQFLREQRAEFRALHDPGYQTQQALAAAAGMDGIAYPTTVVIDRQGTIRGLWIGYATGDERRVRAAIEAALNEPLPLAAE
jgi:cytochrome c biogenesis protein CcmG/thiol:disulfide interchange protein DsbE